MKLYIDENLPPAIVSPLAQLHKRHNFRSWQQESLSGLEDEALFEVLASLGYDGIITQDVRQLVNDNERTALRENGLHWVGVPQLNEAGVYGTAAVVSMIVIGLPYVFDHLSESPHMYRLQPIAGKSSRAPSIDLI